MSPRASAATEAHSSTRTSPQFDRALVLKRTDFQESSRLITLLTRSQGKVTVLAKGAHRGKSALLGRIDFLNLIEVRLSNANLPLLRDAKLLHEPRGLRSPRRYFAASWLAELFDVAFNPGRSDEPLFDLLLGGLRLVERCPEDRIPRVVLALELRFLKELGLCPDLRKEAPWLRDAADRPGRELPNLDEPPTAIRNRLGRWILAATERRATLRTLALRR